MLVELTEQNRPIQLDAPRSDMAVVAAVNDDAVLTNNLLQSPMIRDGGVDVLIERARHSAGEAYNAGLRRTDAPYVMFAHQDVYFPKGWNERLERAIQNLDRNHQPWGLLGVWGIQKNGAYAGRVWCTGSNTQYAAPAIEPVEVESIDEIVIVMNNKAGLRFDEELPGFHLYGTDIVMQARQCGFKTFVFDAPVVHNSRSVYQLDHWFTKAYRYISHKWQAQLPLLTCTVPVTRSTWVLKKRWLKMALGQLRGRLPVHERHPAPAALAAKLGYE